MPLLLDRLPGPSFVTPFVRLYRRVAASEPGQDCAKKDKQEYQQLPIYFGEDQRLDIGKQKNEEQR
jgi:hypothetical protein